MKKIATIAAVAALTTLAACGEAEAPVEAPATEAAGGAGAGAAETNPPAVNEVVATEAAQ